MIVAAEAPSVNTILKPIKLMSNEKALSELSRYAYYANLHSSGGKVNAKLFPILYACAFWSAMLLSLN